MVPNGLGGGRRQTGLIGHGTIPECGAGEMRLTHYRLDITPFVRRCQEVLGDWLGTHRYIVTHLGACRDT